MKTEKCSEEELSIFKNQFNLELGWIIVGNPKKLIVADKVVGLIDISLAPEHGKNAVQIDSFEVFEKGSGIGSAIVVEVLKEFEGYEIYLYSESKQSKKFWMKNGFIPIDDGTGTEILYFSKVNSIVMK